MSLREKKSMEEVGGEKLIRAILRGERPEGIPEDPNEGEKRRRFPPKLLAKCKPIICPDPFDVAVPPRRQMWNKKDFSPITMKVVARHRAKYDLSRLSSKTTEEEEEELDDKSDYEYPNIECFMDLDELERIKSKDFNRDMARYTRDENKSDGFDVGLYPYRDAAGICSSNFLFCHYKPPKVNLPKANLTTLLHLSQLAISVYNMHQVPPTHYDNVQVLKAMKFGPFGTNLNLTFQASSPPVAFQTRLYDHCAPPESPYYSFEIFLVRKADASSLSPQESDYVGVQWLPKFPSCMEYLSDFDEKDPQQYTFHTDIGFKLPLYLSQFALHQYNMDHYVDYDYVKLLSTMKSLNDDQGTTYFITFEASHNCNTPQIFETKLFFSPLLPTTKIKLRFVRIKPN